MKSFVWLLTFVSIISFLFTFYLFIKGAKKETPSTSEQIFFVVSLLSFFIFFFVDLNIPYDRVQTDWSTNLNMETDTIEINDDEKYIEIIRNDNGFLMKSNYDYEGKIVDKCSHQQYVSISAKVIKQTYIGRIEDKIWLEDVVIQDSQ